MIEKEPQESQNQEFVQEILRNIPLETCTLETDPVTGIEGWHAPYGKAFQITGRFIIFSNTSAGDFSVCRPIPSEEEYISMYHEQYESFLKETQGDQEEAVSLLIDDNDDELYLDYPPTSFEGKWLNLEQYGGNQIKLDVREDIQPYIDDGFFLAINNLTPDGDKKNPLFCTTDGMKQFQFVQWHQEYAEVCLGFCTIQLIDYNEPERTLFSPEKKDDAENTILVAEEGSGVTSDDLISSYEELMKITLTDEEREQMRKEQIQLHREVCRPLKDDPLRDFAFLYQQHASRFTPDEKVNWPETLHSFRQQVGYRFKNDPLPKVFESSPTLQVLIPSNDKKPISGEILLLPYTKETNDPDDQF
jgi:hypothetical protein